LIEYNPKLCDDTFKFEIPEGIKTCSLGDGSTVELGLEAKIGLKGDRQSRGFEHIAGKIEVTVAKGDKPFIVETTLGEVEALGTVFAMDLVKVDSVEALAVDVMEGSVKVSNNKGSRIIKANHGVSVEENKAPYDFRQDESLPPRLIERIQSMLNALEAGDARAWACNFNINAMYDLVKGKIAFSEHRDWFSGMSEGDAERVIQMCQDVESPEGLLEILLSGVNISEPKKAYVRSVKMEADGRHAIADCVEVKGQRQYVITTPQWTYFQGDWWQTDD